ncbi:MAG: ATP-binding cassette domain-containing protein, partial [Patescibacteria group bacterium]|nr:ATP-binding cassette domain-containing protein [Patescibacteria group bacterium]
ITIKNLQFKNIIQNINLEIPHGKFITIYGMSGAGKTTFLRILSRLYKQTKGEVQIGGINMDKIKKYGHQSLYTILSYANQIPYIFQNLTLRENILLWSKKEIPDEKIKEILAKLKMEKFADKLDEKVKNFSGGEKVRIGLARSLIKDAKILILDEPTASLDSESARQIIELLNELHISNPDITIICVSHDQRLKEISDLSYDIKEIQK